MYVFLYFFLFGAFTVPLHVVKHDLLSLYMHLCHVPIIGYVFYYRVYRIQSQYFYIGTRYYTTLQYILRELHMYIDLISIQFVKGGFPLSFDLYLP